MMFQLKFHALYLGHPIDKMSPLHADLDTFHFEITHHAYPKTPLRRLLPPLDFNACKFLTILALLITQPHAFRAHAFAP
jgi:hypothetical protein